MAGTKDNWANRATGMVCATCAFYCNTRCRRHAPTMGGFPAVFQTDWCGDHRITKDRINEMEGATPATHYPDQEISGN
ncbi:MAG: hypothetical protein HQL61_09120 [Magnetococcales bacterium]|nr:hypothetical protein [Nitrospirota bacterium]